MSATLPAGPGVATAPLGPVPVASGPLKVAEANLWQAQFAGADLRDADLRRCSLVLADLTGADLRGARLANCDLSLADLRGADLRGADLHAADLSGADLRGARLDGADLSEAELAGARIEGALGTPDAWLNLPRQAERLACAADRNGEPAAARQAFDRAQLAWQRGQFAAAERHLLQARGWLGESDLIDWHLGALALERADPLAASQHWQRAVANHDRADRARLDLALLLLSSGQRDLAIALLQVEKPAWFAELATSLRQGDDPAALAIVQAKLGATPGLKWLQRPAPRQPAPVTDGDPAALAAEREDLLDILKDPQQAAWVWHGAIARALAIGDLELAQRADQRLLAVAPDHRLWGLQLRQLDVTAQAFAELARTRDPAPTPPQQVRWVALGAHGPTARLLCGDQVCYAKRYDGTTRPVASVAYTHRIARSLAARGVHVPVAIADANGDDTMVFGSDLLALYPSVGGQPVDTGDLDSAGAHELGAALAQIHLLGQDLAGNGRPRGGLRAGSRIVRSGQARAMWLAWLSRDPLCISEFQRFAQGTLLLDLLECTARRLSRVALDCPLGLTHGDFAGGNVLRRADGGLAVVDWDLCDADLLVWDLARSLDLIGVQWPEEPHQAEHLRPSLLRALLAGYHAVRPLRAAERLALPVLVAASRLDLDASVLPLCVRFEPQLGLAIWQKQLARLTRAAAGAPELAEVFAPVFAGS